MLPESPVLGLVVSVVVLGLVLGGAVGGWLLLVLDEPLAGGQAGGLGQPEGPVTPLGQALQAGRRRQG